MPPEELSEKLIESDEARRRVTQGVIAALVWGGILLVFGSHSVISLVQAAIIIGLGIALHLTESKAIVTGHVIGLGIPLIYLFFFWRALKATSVAEGQE